MSKRNYIRRGGDRLVNAGRVLCQDPTPTSQTWGHEDIYDMQDPFEARAAMGRRAEGDYRVCENRIDRDGHHYMVFV
jgi:hypothetical protein